MANADESLNLLDRIGIKYGNNQKNGHQGGDKTSLIHNYLNDYQKLFTSHGILRDGEFELFEIGIFEGRSLATWADYFTNAKIYGLDINLKNYNECLDELKSLGYDDRRVIIDKGSSIDKIPMNRIYGEIPRFAIIIDDGNHMRNNQFLTFMVCFPLLLSKGIYIVEDTHHNESMLMFMMLSNYVANYDEVVDKTRKDRKRQKKYLKSIGINDVTIPRHDENVKETHKLTSTFLYTERLDDYHVKLIESITFVKRRVIIIKK
jgi:hypothetical protein